VKRRKSTRSLAEGFREALRLLKAETGPLTQGKSELMEYLRNRVAEHEKLDRLIKPRDYIAKQCKAGSRFF